MNDIDLSVEGMKSHFRELLSGQRESLVKATMLCGVLCFPFAICAFVVAGTANAGFNVVLTAFIQIAFQSGAYYVLNMLPTRSSMMVGFLIGCSAMLTLMMLMCAIYWGQLSNCEKMREDINQYSCDNPTGYGAVCFFGSLLFIIQVFFTYGLVIWRDEITSLEESNYNSLPSTIGHGIESPYDEHGLKNRPSADL
jgi:hypothetical protein